MTNLNPWVLEYFSIDEDMVVENRLIKELEIYDKRSGYGWIHLDGKLPETKIWLKESSGIEEIWVDALLEKETRPRFVKIDSNSFFVNFRGINSFNKEEPEDMISIRLYITRNQIISTQLRHLEAIDKIKKDFGMEYDIPSSTTEFLLKLIWYINEEIESTIVNIYSEIDDLEEMALTVHDRDFRQNVIDIRRQTIIFRRYLFPNLYVLHQLQTMNNFFVEESDALSNLLENTHKMTRFTEEIVSVRERAQVVHEELNNHLTERLTSTTSKLSVVATIFLPLTFVTGLFGINIGGIPGTNNHNAFWIFCSLTLMILIIQIIIFRWFKWF